MSTIPSLTPLTPIGTEEVYVTDGLTNKRVTLNAIAALAVDTNTGILNVVEDITPQLGGSLDTNTFDINLGADDGIFPTVAPTSDHNASGNKATLTAGESLVFGDVCYIKSDGKAWKADADGAAPAERGLLIALATILADAPGVFSLPGSFIRDDTWGWTVGNPIYLSATAGALTQTAPTPAIVMGIATHADRMYFYPTIQDAASDGGGAVMDADYNANTILAADTDDTPAPLTIAEQTVVGRITGGSITALTATQLRTLINVEDGADVTDATNVAAAGALLTSGGTMSGTLSLADNIVSRPVLEDYAIQGSAVGAVGATRTFDCAVANYFTATLDQACTFTFSNPPATGDAGGFRLVLTNGGAYAITFPAAVDWDGGTAPTLTAAGVDIIDFTTSDAGTIWYGTVVGSDMK